jgi:ribulose-5-phosphate 4-epimerase/fuculose-1-phosphate aldolase
MISTGVSDYIYLSKLFGACIDYVQATGGNISVKTATELIIKKSGFAMAETTESKGYVICSLDTLSNREIPIDNSIISGDLPGKPSMEIFFHLLSPKYIIHIHPTAMMKDLCSRDFGVFRTLFPTALFVPYFQPGQVLGDYIVKNYSSESIIFLANHGVIFLGESINELIETIDNAFSLLNKKSSDIKCMHLLYSQIGAGHYIKPSFLLSGHLNKSVLLRYTPDFHLFLGPAVCNLEEESVEDYKLKWNGKLPSILYSKNQYYLISSSSKSADFIEQMFYSYITAEFDNCLEIGERQQCSLEDDPKEKARILSFKA